MATQSTRRVKRMWAPTDYDPVKALIESQPVFGEVSINPASLATNTEAETTASIAAVLPEGVSAAAGDVVFVNPPSDLEAGLMVKSVRISAANTLGITLRNVTGSTIDGAAKTWTFCLIRAPRYELV